MAEEAETEAPKKGSSKLIIIIVAAVLVLALGGFAAWFFLMSGDPEPTEATAAAPAAEVVKKEAIYVKIRTEGGKPYFVSNFTGESGGQRFLQVYVEALTRDESVKSELQKHMPLIVSQLQMLFSSQSLREMQTAEGRARLQLQATDQIQSFLKAETGQVGIETVFFTNFVMQ